MEPVAIIGAGMSRFGRRTDARIDELAWESFREAMEDAGVTQKDIDQFVVSSLGSWSGEFLPAVVVGEYCGLAWMEGVDAGKVKVGMKLKLVVGKRKADGIFTYWFESAKATSP